MAPLMEHPGALHAGQSLKVAGGRAGLRVARDGRDLHLLHLVEERQASSNGSPPEETRVEQHQESWNAT